MGRCAVLDMAELKRAVTAELARRRGPGADFRCARERGGPETLYGLTGAVNIHAALGLSLGDRRARADAAASILAWRQADGLFDDGSGPGHALHMVLGALNLLAEPVPPDLGPLAPLAVAALPAWLARHDWRSTHKELCGQTIPLLASGRVDAEWTALFVRGIAARLDPAQPLATWCAADDPPWRVISCLYHVLSAFDAGRLPYPRPERLARRLLDLHWDDAPDSAPRTVCTDGDWAWLLLRLCERLPRHAPAALRAIRRVSARRVRQWQANREAALALDTHHLYCFLWVTAVFQSCVRDHYSGGVLRDTLNDPALFRLRT
jgi:hypothetical protein